MEGSNEKLKYALKKFLEPGFHVKNDVPLNSVLTYLTHKGPEGLEENTVLEKEYLKSWIVDAFSLWKVTEKLPDNAVLAFAVRILALLSEKGQNCFDLGNMAFFENFINVLKLRDEGSSPEVQMAFVELLSSILEHDSGVDFFIITGYWEDVLKMCLRRQTIDLTKGAIRLLSEFLGKASLTHEDFCTNVLQLILKPLKKYCFNDATTQADFIKINEQEVYCELLPTLHFFINVLEYAYDKQLNFESEAKLAVIILENVDGENGIRNIMLLAKGADFFYDLMKINMLLLLLQLLSASKDGVCATKNLDVIYTKIRHLQDALIAEGRFYVSRIMYLVMYYWDQLQKSTYQLEEVFWEKQKITMDNQAAIMTLLPFCCMDPKYCGTESVDEFKDQFLDTFVRKNTHYTIAIIYKWRDQFHLSDRDYIANFRKELPYIMKSRTLYSRENVAMMFMCHFHYIKCAVVRHDDPMIQVYFTLNSDIVVDILNGMNTLIREFNMKWTDTFETICVLNIIYDFLNIHSWDTNIIVAGLKLITTAIEKYMTPNMTLLIDRVNDSSINELGPFLVVKLHDPECQVRDSALETILVIAEASKCKFQSFRSILSDVQIPRVVLEICLNDEESFVRAAALKCLAKMCLVDEYWDNFLETQEVVEKTIKMLQNETEGIVRTEAATLLTTLYQHQPFSLDICTAIYETMVSAVINDLHWEVRLNALSFWENTLEDELTKQGMIDGEFPESIFSIEKKRIIHLNNEEIAKRLSSVVQKLCDVGCLAVLTTALQDDCNLQVSKRALQILNRLIKLLEKYNVKSVEHQCVESTFNDVVSPSSDSSGVVTSPQSMIDGDMIIDEILGSTDSALLKGVYFPSDSTPVRDSNFVNRRRKVSCSSFFEFLKLDLRGILNDREKWLDSLDSLDSLLNDILDSYDENNDLNVMDCY